MSITDIIITICRGTFPAIGIILPRLFEQSRLYGIPLNITIYTDSHEDEVAEIVKKHEKQISVCYKKCDEGSTRGLMRNAAAACTAGKRLVFLDSGCIPGKAFLVQHCAEKTNNTRNVVLGCIHNIPGTGINNFGSGRESGFIKDIRLELLGSRVRKINRLLYKFILFNGGNFSIDRGLWKELGGYDGGISEFTEDIDLGMKMSENNIGFILSKKAAVYRTQPPEPAPLKRRRCEYDYYKNNASHALAQGLIFSGNEQVYEHYVKYINTRMNRMADLWKICKKKKLFIYEVNRK